jgi:hypothetical protein
VYLTLTLKLSTLIDIGVLNPYPQALNPHSLISLSLSLSLSLSVLLEYKILTQKKGQGKLKYVI